MKNNRRRFYAGALAGIAVLGFGKAAAIQIVPSRYDFGKVVVMGVGQPPKKPGMMVFEIFFPDGVKPSSVTLTGPHAAEFGLYTSLSGCPKVHGGVLCEQWLDFAPRSLGQKTATLVATDDKGNTATAALTGEGIGAVCEIKVVWCNYAHLYSGTLIWNGGTQAPGSQSREQVQVDVIAGAATCNGTVTESEQGRTKIGTITGPGLVAVEFDRDGQNKPVYRITVACPSPSWPATADTPATPSEPAELGHNEQNSYDQPAPYGPGMNLKGDYSTPYSDSVNGQTGTTWVSWELCQQRYSKVVQVAGQNKRICV